MVVRVNGPGQDRLWQPRKPRVVSDSVGQASTLRLNGPNTERLDANPLDVLSDILAGTHRMFHDGYPEEGRRWLVLELQGLLRQMCPLCGRTDDHEYDFPQIHKFEAPRQRILG